MSGGSFADVLGLFFLEEHAFFDENVLSGFESINRHPRMEIEGSGYQHRINVLPVQQLPIVFVGIRLGADCVDSLLEIGRVDIAGGNASPCWYRGQKPQQSTALRSRADKAVTHRIAEP